ncbi:hypothetical protein [Anaerosinus massiliensis]|uniref:hypothetical protein n=1 Tax=Massilibacillus massiliensis TaxID=1806837 RepID=UPI000DA61876|nr:hypothetical protein [Massilibacillus massiliensis]
MPSLIYNATEGISSENQGSIIQITLTNNNAAGGAAVANFIVTAIYAGTTTEYIWSESVTTLAAEASTSFNLSIDNETYDANNLHVGISFLNTI